MMIKEILRILSPFLILFSTLTIFVKVYNAILPFFDVQQIWKIKVTQRQLIAISVLLSIPVIMVQSNMFQSMISSAEAPQAPTVSSIANSEEPKIQEQGNRASEIESITEEPAETEPTTKEVALGDVLTIGTYAGKSINWKVLDVRDNKAFLLSTKVVKDIKYHDQEGTVTWGECSLHKWLNGAFLTTAFSKEEQAAILTTTVDNGTDQGNPEWPNSGSGNTKDKIFLLSYAEFERYVEDSDFSICEAAYSTKPGEDMRVELLDNGTEAAFWWLRSPGVNGKQAAFINFEGKCFSNYATNWYLSARPAMWVDINKIDELEN